LAERVSFIQDIKNSAELHIDREKLNAEKLRKKLKKETQKISKKNKSLIQDLPEQILIDVIDEAESALEDSQLEAG
jgi:hypothetical protein